MYGIVRSRLATAISNYRRRLPLNLNSRNLTTTTSAPPPSSPNPSGSGWIDKLTSHSRKYLILGSIGASLCGSTAFLTQKFMAKSDDKSEFEKHLGDHKFDFPYDEYDLVNDESIRKLYDRWLTHHSKSYRHPKKKEAHYQVFKEKAYMVHFHNKTSKAHRLGLNQFSDLTTEEVNKYYTGHVVFK